jgi:hypothetical protein
MKKERKNKMKWKCVVLYKKKHLSFLGRAEMNINQTIKTLGLLTKTSLSIKITPFCMRW